MTVELPPVPDSLIVTVITSDPKGGGLILRSPLLPTAKMQLECSTTTTRLPLNKLKHHQQKSLRPSTGLGAALAFKNLQAEEKTPGWAWT